MTTYFVTYSHVDGCVLLNGNGTIVTEKSISNIDDIRDLENKIELEKGDKQVTILSWREF